jgi:hypothetical protein
MISGDIALTVIICTAIICYTAYKIAKLRQDRKNDE